MLITVARLKNGERLPYQKGYQLLSLRILLAGLQKW